MVPLNPVPSTRPGQMTLAATVRGGRPTGARVKRLVALTLIAFWSGAALSAGPSQASVNLYGIDVQAGMEFKQCFRQVQGHATVTYSVGNSQGVWAWAAAYDYSYGRWNYSGRWVPADGVADLFVDGMYTPYPWAYVMFGRYVSGYWRQADGWAQIDPGVGGGVFC
jgi:hypothetical protein